MKTPYFQINAFTTQFNGGNPAGVCPLNAWLSDEKMQQISAENNLSETAFFVACEHGCDSDYELRWFTPSCEIDLCGHATLATAHYLFYFAQHSNSQIRFKTRSGQLIASQNNGFYSIELPSTPLKSGELPANLINGFSKPIEDNFQTDDYFLIFDDEDFIKNLRPDFDLIQDIDLRGTVVTALSKKADVDFVSRVFGSKTLGIKEDPATGSTHVGLTQYWSKKLNKIHLVGEQLSSRGAIIHCELMQQSVIISGSAYCYSEGYIHI